LTTLVPSCFSFSPKILIYVPKTNESVQIAGILEILTLMKKFNSKRSVPAQKARRSTAYHVEESAECKIFSAAADLM